MCGAAWNEDAPIMPLPPDSVNSALRLAGWAVTR